MANRWETRLRLAEIKGRTICRWMLLAWMPPLQPTFEKQSHILEVQNRVESPQGHKSGPEAAE